MHKYTFYSEVADPALIQVNDGCCGLLSGMASGGLNPVVQRLVCLRVRL